MTNMYAGGDFVRPYYFDPNCPDYLKPMQFTNSMYIPNGSIFNNYPPMPPMYNNPSIMQNPNIRPQAQMPYGPQAGYEADDGKISFGSKVKNFLKGVIKPVTNMFSSPGNFIKGALGIAAGVGLVALTGGAITPVLVAAGVVGGGVKFAQGAINAADATTDAEAEAAWQDIGEGTGAVAASVAGSKAALKKAGVDTSGMSYLKATKECFTSAPKQLSTSWATATGKISAFFGGGTTGAVAGGGAKTGAAEQSGGKTEPVKTETQKTSAQKSEFTGSDNKIKGVIKDETINGNRYIETADGRKIVIDKNGTQIDYDIDLDGGFKVNHYGETEYYQNNGVQTKDLVISDTNSQIANSKNSGLLCESKNSTSGTTTNSSTLKLGDGTSTTPQIGDGKTITNNITTNTNPSTPSSTGASVKTTGVKLDSNGDIIFDKSAVKAKYDSLLTKDQRKSFALSQIKMYHPDTCGIEANNTSTITTFLYGLLKSA